MRGVKQGILGLALAGAAAAAPSSAWAVASFSVIGTPQVGVNQQPFLFTCAGFGLAAGCSIPTPDGTIVEGSWLTNTAATSGTGTITTTFVPGVEDITSFTNPQSTTYTESFGPTPFRNFPASTGTLATSTTLDHSGSADNGGAVSGGVGANGVQRTLIRFAIANTGNDPFVVPWVAIPRLDVSTSADLGDESDARANLNLIFATNATDAQTQQQYNMTVGDIRFVDEFGSQTLGTAPKFNFNAPAGVAAVVGQVSGTAFTQQNRTFADGTNTTTGNIPFQTWFTTTVQPGQTGLFYMEFATLVNLSTVERTQVIPLPGALPLMAAAMGGLALVRRRRKAA